MFTIHNKETLNLQGVGHFSFMMAMLLLNDWQPQPEATTKALPVTLTGRAGLVPLPL